MKKIIFVFTILVCSSALADLSRTTLFSLNTIYLDRDYTTNGSSASDKITDTDMRLMKIEKNWSYGLIYSLSANDASNANRTSYGVSVGYYSERDFYLNYHYYYSSKFNFGSGNEYSKGNGYEFDLGFLSKVTSSFYVGLMFAIKNFSYSEQTSGGTTTSISATHKEVMPMFTFAVNFM